MLFGLIIVAAIIAAVTWYTLKLGGEDLSQYDRDVPVSVRADLDSDGNKSVRAFLRENFIEPSLKDLSRKDLLAEKRRMFEQVGTNVPLDGVTIKPDTVHQNGLDVPGEWVLAENYDPDQRLLYLHGGAFTVGSPVSHRQITTYLAKTTGCAVFVPDYRLMPENKRRDIIDDAKASYQWILDNGPDGPVPAQKLAMAGDSAGGNLTFVLLLWARDTGLRAVDAAIGLSPLLDSTFSGPSIKGNLQTDLMLRPIARPLAKIPRPLLLWMTSLQNRIPTSSTEISPIFADLSGLPPALLHVSECEILLDDSKRFAAKAEKQGSHVTLRIYENMCHVWQIFADRLPEARLALDDIAGFMGENGVGHAEPVKASAS